MVSAKAINYISIGVTATGALVVVLTGVLGWVAVPKIIESVIKKQTRLVEGSLIYDKWKDIPIPIYFKVWFFNLTNYEDFEDLSDFSKQPHFQEVGPFVWREHRVRYDLRDGPDDTLFYRQNTTYIFDRELTAPGLEEDTRLTLLNAPLVAAVTLLDIYNITRVFSPLVLKSLIASGESLFMKNVSVKDIVFTGVNLKPVYHTFELFAKIFNVPLPNEFMKGVFAAYREKNGTNHEGVWQVYKGVEDSEKFNIIKSVGDRTDLKEWWDGPCAMINGTDGILFPPLIEKSRRLEIYSPEISRSVWMEYSEESEFEGIPAFRYKMGKDVFTDPAVYEPNWCFSMPALEPKNSSYNFNGISRVFSTKDNVPIVLSKPHFLDADEWMLEKGARMGMKPNREEHDAYADIEPKIGFPMRGHKRMQINMETQPYKTFHMEPFDTIPHEIYPLLWVDETAELDEALVKELKSKMLTPLKIVEIGKWVVLGIGIVLFLAGGIFILYLRHKRNTEQSQNLL